MTLRPSFPLVAGTVLIAAIAALLCLIPKPENDLFFELRIGTDILHAHRLPHADTYSWTNYGRRWAVPEWGAMTLYALAYREGGFFGTWLLLAGLTVAAAWTVWARLARSAGVAWAFVLTTLMLLAMSDSLQERPYAFSYLLLAVSLGIVTHARAHRLRALLWLLPLCALWASLHQGVLVVVGLLAVYGLGDALGALFGHSSRRRAAAMLGAAAACAGAALLSPYGWGLYRDVFLTLHDRTLMAGVTEWNPVTALPPPQLEPLVAVAVAVFGTLALSRPRSLPDALAALALLVNALLHARNIALFAAGGLVIAAPHLPSAARQVRRALGLTSLSAVSRALLALFALLFVAAVALVSLVRLHGAAGPRGLSPEGIGEAAARTPEYPAGAVALMRAEDFPPRLRLLNDFEVGGFLLWRLPSEPVFADGRLDVYAGRTFRDMLVLERAPGTPAWSALVRRYDFDCVLTKNRPEARAFASDPGWRLVYAARNTRRAPCYFLLLRRRPGFAALIARCVRAGGANTQKEGATLLRPPPP